MRTLFSIIIIGVCLTTIIHYCSSKKDPYELGRHWDYTILCENGFVYKVLDNQRGIIQIYNSDNTPLKCGNKIY